MTNFLYRKAALDDLDAIMLIYTAAQRLMEERGNPQWGKGFPDKNDVKWGILGGILYVVTADGGEIAAVFSVAGYDRDYDEIDGKWLTDGVNYLAVHRVATAEKFRGTGAAKFILSEAAVEIAARRGKTSIRMDTHEKNAPMRALLLSRGFTHCGTVSLIRDDTLRLAFEKLI